MSSERSGRAVVRVACAEPNARTSLPAEDYHTVAGFVFGLLGRQPEVGDDISHDGLRFDVLEVDGSRINKIAVTFEQRRDQKGRDEAERDDLEAELFDADN